MYLILNRTLRIVGIIFFFGSLLFAQKEVETLYNQGKFANAIQIGERYVKSSKQINAGLYYYIGSAYLEMAKLSDALEYNACTFGNLYYQLQIPKNKKEPLFYYFNGLCLVGLKKNQEAMHSFKNAVNTGKKPYADYANIWLQVLSGKKIQLKSFDQELEYEVALVFSKKQSNYAKQLVDKTNSKQLKNKHNYYNYLMLKIALEDRLEKQLQTHSIADTMYVTSLKVTENQNAVHYLFYNPIVYKYLSLDYYRMSLKYLLPLEEYIVNPEEKNIILKKIANAYIGINNKETLNFLKDKSNPALQNFYAEILYKSGAKNNALEIWLENIKSKDKVISAYAGYYLAKYNLNYNAGLTACKTAWSAAWDNQELAVLLVDLFAIKQNYTDACQVLDQSLRKSRYNVPLFLLYYAYCMYNLNPTRDNDTVGALYKLQNYNVIARQVHYYIQGLIAKRTKLGGEIRK